MTPVEDPQNPVMLLHVFSNGGSIALENTRAAFRRATGKPLPPHITVYDSCPGLHNYRRDTTAFASWAAPGSLTNLLVAVPLAHFLVCLYWLMYTPWGRAGPLNRVAAAQNDPEVVVHEVARAYMYSKEDRIVDWRHVEEHAAKARQSGFNVHEMALFEGSRHVLHSRQDGERYCGIVNQIWTQHKVE